MPKMIGSVRATLLKRCHIVICRTVLYAKRRGMLSKPVDISIDGHDIPFHAKCTNKVCSLGSRGKKVTYKFNRLATVHCVTNGHRLTLGTMVVQENDTPKGTYSTPFLGVSIDIVPRIRA